MDALVMCGGRGSRLGDAVETEKPLVPVCGVPMVERVVAALRESRVEAVYAAVSPEASETARYVRERSAGDASLSVVETAGEGYVADLTDALDAVGRPAVTVAADLPLLTADHVDGAVAAAEAAGTDVAGADAALRAGGVASVTVCVPADLKRRLGVSVDASFEREGRELAPTGLNVVAGDADTVRLTCDDRLAVNVNRPTDLERAEALCD